MHSFSSFAYQSLRSLADWFCDVTRALTPFPSELVTGGGGGRKGCGDVTGCKNASYWSGGTYDVIFCKTTSY